MKLMLSTRPHESEMSGIAWRILLWREQFSVTSRRWDWKKAYNARLPGGKRVALRELPATRSKLKTTTTKQQQHPPPDQCPCDSFPISENIGRYIETTIDPMVTPRNPIKAGSISVKRFAIAASTSCS